MKKLYTEEQYEKYCELLGEMANEDDMTIGFGIHLEIEDYFKKNRISRQARDQMDERLEKEADGERPELKRIK